MLKKIILEDSRGKYICSVGDAVIVNLTSNQQYDVLKRVRVLNIALAELQSRGFMTQGVTAKLVEAI